MKIFCFILSAYVILLSVSPCDTESSCSADDSSFEISTNGEEHDHDDHDPNDCSPFCSCTCCVAHVVIPTIQEFPDTIRNTSFSFLSLYLTEYSFEYNEGVWHPPSVS